MSRKKRIKRYFTKGKKLTLSQELGYKGDMIKCIECGKPIDQNNFIQWLFETCVVCFE